MPKLTHLDLDRAIYVRSIFLKPVPGSFRSQIDRFWQFLQRRARLYLFLRTVNFFVTRHYCVQSSLHLIFVWEPKDLLHTGSKITHTRSPYYWYFAQHPTGPCRIPKVNTVENHYSTTYHSSERPKRCNQLSSKQIEQTNKARKTNLSNSHGEAHCDRRPF